jgi:hypothetical protein
MLWQSVSIEAGDIIYFGTVKKPSRMSELTRQGQVREKRDKKGFPFYQLSNLAERLGLGAKIDNIPRLNAVAARPHSGN